MNAAHLVVPRALLLDADPASFMGLRASLDERGFEVPGASDGAAGVALLLDTLMELDVLVLDADLPGLNAEAFLHLVREAGGERELGIVVVSSGLHGERRRSLLSLGADAVVDRRQGPAVVAEAAAGAAALTAERRDGVGRRDLPLDAMLDAARALAS